MRKDYKQFPDSFGTFITYLKNKLQESLPGYDAQIKMSGIRHFRESGNMAIPDDANHGGVLALLYPIDNKPAIAFIKRTEYDGAHSGQISFPGGKMEHSDLSVIYTALRETEEEIGVPANEISVIGHLTELYIPPSRFLVTPIVGYIVRRPQFHPDSTEVERIIEIPVEKLISEDAIQEKEIEVMNGIKWNVPCYYIDGNIIWGATAMMLSELLELITREF